MKTTTFLLSLCFSLTGFAQNYDFGKISKEELEEKYNPLDTSANATYLYKNRKTYIKYDQTFGFQLLTDVYERIKIYNQEGFEYATQQLQLYKRGSDEEKVSSLKANTYNLVNGKIEETKLSKDGIFKTEVSKYYNQTKFTMPNIKVGSVIEYNYSIVSPFFYNVDDFVFQHAIPVKKLEASFETPEYYSFKSNTKGYLNVSPTLEAKTVKLTLIDKPKFGTGVGGARESSSTATLNYLSNKVLYNLKDVPALKDEPYVNNMDNYRAAVSYELSYIKYPNSPYDYYSTTWENVVKTIYDSSSFGDELNKTGYFEEDINELISTVSDPLKRAALIYDFVKSKIKWNNYYGKFCDGGVRKAYKDQVGNVAEINLMLTAMLRYAGLNANPVLVSTRDNGVPLFPTIDGYNYVISCIETDQGVILLDASNKYGTPNVLPLLALNWEGRIIRKDKSSSTINLYPSKPSMNTISMLLNLNEKGAITGNIRSVMTSHNAMSFRQRYIETNKEQFIEKLENEHKGMEIEGHEVINDINLSEPVTEIYKFTLESQADVINDKLYFTPLFFLKTSENPFKLENREFPVDFAYSSETVFRVIVNLPEGYQIESLPEPILLKMPDDIAEFKYNVVKNGKSIQITISDKINTPVVTASYYDVLKPYFSKLIEKQAEQIVLSKI